MAKRQPNERPIDPAVELQDTFRMFETLWESTCRVNPGKRERTADLVRDIRNRLFTPANAPRRGRPQLTLIQGGAA